MKALGIKHERYLLYSLLALKLPECSLFIQNSFVVTSFHPKLLHIHNSLCKKLLILLLLFIMICKMRFHPALFSMMMRLGLHNYPWRSFALPIRFLDRSTSNIWNKSTRPLTNWNALILHLIDDKKNFMYIIDKLHQRGFRIICHQITPLIRQSHIKSRIVFCSLKKLSKPPAIRPVQPVKAIQKPASPLGKREKMLNVTSANTRPRKDSKEIKKNIDVVVTSQPFRKRMSFKRSRRALLPMHVSLQYQ